jgi:Ca-activated chloride channel family protein
VEGADTVMDLRFIAWPWALSLVVVLPLATIWMVIQTRRVHAQRLSHLGTPEMIARLAPETVRTSRWRPVRLGLAVLFAAIAFAGPRWGVERTVVNQAGIDVVLALDASNSMLARDEKPDRLTKMKEVANRLRDLSPNDRFSIVAFAGSAYVLTPLTIDNAALNLFLDNLDPTVVGQVGSSISSAITMSLRLLASSKSESERAIVVMSDGEGFEDQQGVVDAAKQAADAGVTIITVGFGTPQGATIPVRENGTVTQKRDQSGQIVVTRYQPDLLRAAAEAGRGVFIEPTVTDRAAAVRQVLARLRTQQRSLTTGSNLALQFQLFLIPAVLLLLLDTLLAARHVRRRRFAAPAMTAAAAAAALISGACGILPSPRDHAAIALYNQGTALVLKRDSIPQTLRAQRIAAESSAVSLLHRAAESADTAVRYRAGFNEGYVHLTVGLAAKADSAATPLDSALAVYKRVLLMRPDDGDAKWNYELALRQKKNNGGGGGEGGGGGGGAPKPQPAPASSAEQKPAPRPIPGMNEQRAEQILNAMEKEEQDVQGKQQRKNVPKPPPAGKDW